MALSSALQGFIAARQQGDQQDTAQLQQAGALQQILAAAGKAKRDASLRDTLAQSGGDLEGALKAAITAGDLQAAAHLEPLVKMKREADSKAQAVQAMRDLNAPEQAAAAGPQLLAGPGAQAGAAETPTVQDPRQARIDKLNKLSVLYAGNAVVSQRIQSELDRLSAIKPMVEHQFSVGENLVQPHISYDEGRTWAPVPGSKPSAKFAKQVAPTVNVNNQEAPAGLSAQYGTDATYKKNVDYWANLLKEGGTLPPRFAQSGAGKKMMPDILNVVPTLGAPRDMLANQVDLTGQKSEARSVGTRAANVEMAAGEAREMMPILQQTSEAFKRTGYQPINQVFKAFQDKTGSVESRQFGAALNSFVNVYARAVSPSGVPTVSDKDHAREILSTADSHEQLMGLLKVLDQEMVAAQNAPKRVRDAQRAGMTGTPAPAHGPAAPAPVGAPAPKNDKGWGLMVDAQGNRAYVSPDGKQFEEVK